MMMGPEPMIRMRWRSLRRGISESCWPGVRHAHQFDEVVEEIERIVRAGRGFGVVLHAERRVVAVTETFERLVVEVHVSEFDVEAFERIGIDREAMIVRGDLDLLRELIEHRVVGAAMSEFQLVGFTASGKTHELMAEADAEDGRAAEQLADVGDLRFERLGIAGAVGEKHAVGLERQHVFSGSQGRNHGDAAAGVRQTPENVALDAVVVGDYVIAAAGAAR